MTNGPSIVRPDGPTLRGHAQAASLGLYLHVPFCKSRCHYCSFASEVATDVERQAYVFALGESLAHWGDLLGCPRLDTVYVGGGTPSLLPLHEISALWQTMAERFDVGTLEEATLEVNPATVDLAWLQGARRLGFDRLSVGVQSLEDGLLVGLGRCHRASVALETLAWARQAGFERLSADLMVGIPGQRLHQVCEDAERLVEAGATHLSIYLLDLDKECPLKAQVDEGQLVLPEDDAVADVFEALQARLPTLGLLPYEISNYAAVGQTSRHNCRYWHRRPYLGLGPSAASQIGPWRWCEPSPLAVWLEKEKGDALDALEECQALTPEEVLAEIPLLGLRMHEGVDWGALRQEAQRQGLLALLETWEKALRPFFHHGLLEKRGDRISLTAKGMLLSNPVFSVFV